jgi:pilus assembly protein TadC
VLNNPQIFVAAFIALIFFVLYLMIDGWITKKQKVRRIERDAKLTSAYDEQGYSQEITSPIELEQESSGLAKALEQLMRVIGIDVDKALSIAKPQATQAGFSTTNAPIYLLFYQKIFGYVVAFAGVLVLLKSQETLNLAVGGILLVLGLFGAKLYVSNQTQKRKKSLLRSFPDGLDLMVVCVESGLALDAAVNRVCTELGYAHPALAKELNRTRLELALLNNRSQALTNLAERTDLVAFRSLVAALIQTEKFGTNLTDTLRVLSDDYRQSRLMQAEEKAGRLPALMAIPLVLLLLPSFMLIILGPPFIKLKQQGGLFGNR